MKTLGKYLNYIVIALIVVLSIMYVMNVNQPYYKDMNASLIMLLCISLVLAVVPLFLKNHSKLMILLSDICQVAVPVIVIYTAVRFLAMRIESFGYIFASNLEAGNEAATAAGTQAVWLLVLFVITWILSVIVSFFKLKKA